MECQAGESFPRRLGAAVGLAENSSNARAPPPLTTRELGLDLHRRRHRRAGHTGRTVRRRRPAEHAHALIRRRDALVARGVADEVYRRAQRRRARKSVADDHLVGFELGGAARDASPPNLFRSQDLDGSPRLRHRVQVQPRRGPAAQHGAGVARRHRRREISHRVAGCAAGNPEARSDAAVVLHRGVAAYCGDQLGRLVHLAFVRPHVHWTHQPRGSVPSAGYWRVASDRCRRLSRTPHALTLLSQSGAAARGSGGDTGMLSGETRSATSSEPCRSS